MVGSFLFTVGTIDFFPNVAEYNIGTALFIIGSAFFLLGTMFTTLFRGFLYLLSFYGSIETEEKYADEALGLLNVSEV